LSTGRLAATRAHGGRRHAGTVSTLPGAVSTVLGPLADLVLPRCCLGCGRPGAVLCATCLPHGPPAALDVGLPVLAAAPYEGGVRAALLAYKERGRRDLAGCLAGLLARSVGPGPALLVPVPSSRAAVRSRGGDTLLRLARAAARRTGGRVATPLRLTRAVQDSARLGVGARSANLAGAMAAAPPRFAGEAVLVDDIVTTGATLREALRALSVAGWQVHAAAVVAATARHEERRPKDR
jgi:predicted amidophosphoribosyltransferase